MKCNTTIRFLRDIADIQTGPFGSQLHKEDYVEYGTPIVTVEHLGNRKFTEQNLPKVSDSDKERLKKYVLATDDIVFSRVGSVDRCSYVDEEHNGWMFSGRCLRVRPSEDIDSLYLYYYFCREEIRQFVRNIAVGATMPSINTKLLGEIPVAVPDLQIQKVVSNILSTIDDKIELNNKINANLQQQAQAIFKSWFVDFEPFQDGEFVESELGPIPKGWTAKRADSIFDISIGKTPPRKEKEWFSLEKTDIKWVSISDMGKCGVYISDTSERLTHSAIEKHNIKIVPDNTVILSFKLTVGRVAITHGEMATNEAIAHFKTSDDILVPYLYCSLKNFNFQALGSTSSIATAVNSKLIKQMLILYPNELVIESFASAVFPLFNQIKVLEEENKKLSAIRDSLLPKLMSGELSVNEVQ